MEAFEEPASVLEDVGNLIGYRRRYEEHHLARTCDSAKAVAGVLPALYTTVLNLSR